MSNIDISIYGELLMNDKTETYDYCPNCPEDQKGLLDYNGMYISYNKFLKILGHENFQNGIVNFSHYIEPVFADFSGIWLYAENSVAVRFLIIENNLGEIGIRNLSFTSCNAMIKFPYFGDNEISEALLSLSNSFPEVDFIFSKVYNPDHFSQAGIEIYKINNGDDTLLFDLDRDKNVKVLPTRFSKNDHPATKDVLYFLKDECKMNYPGRLKCFFPR